MTGPVKPAYYTAARGYGATEGHAWLSKTCPGGSVTA